MADTYPNPWNFHNIDKSLLSSDQFHKVVYYDLNEIAIGAPIGGSCYLETVDHSKKVKIHDWCGGPAIWEKEGYLLALPIWTRTVLKGTVQQIGILDLRTMELKIFAENFRVLNIRSFENTVIYAYDSPIYQTKKVIFDIKKQKIETKIQLKQ